MNIQTIEARTLYTGQIRRRMEEDRKRARTYLKEARKYEEQARKDLDPETAIFWGNICTQQIEEINFLNAQLKAI